MSEPSEFEIALYVVATPLGNLGDITQRAVSVFSQVSVIACEDTRVTRDLLRLLGIPAPVLFSVREHNEREAADSVIAKLAAGTAVAYASDAGTPAISDPGARLVAAVRGAGFPIIPVPGVSAVTAALSVAGFEDTAFTFVGFAPVTPTTLAQFVERIASRVETTVFFESPHRADKTLQALAAGLPAECRVVIARELTKKFETIVALAAGEIDGWRVANAERMRGEFVIVVAGTTNAPTPAFVDAQKLLKTLLEELPPAKAAKLTAKITGESRETLYALAEKLKTDR